MALLTQISSAEKFPVQWPSINKNYAQFEAILFKINLFN